LELHVFGIQIIQIKQAEHLGIWRLK